MSAKTLVESYKKARNSPDALRIGVKFDFGLKLFLKKNEDKENTEAATAAVDFSVPVIDIAAAVGAVSAVLLCYELVRNLIDLIRYKKRF